ncbi:MAG: Rad52/Rad22 family DNA repair protein [Desulfobulbaceae bacterium]|nr:Rad52/Rad22 family DNA repair protein [Desulfobulbaceae bacterium]
MAATLKEKIDSINERLRSFGKEAVQETKMTSKDGKVIGQIKYGYRSQYVFDCVNEVLGPENWRYELTKEEIFETQAVAEVKLFLKVDGEWFCKGSQKGQMQIVKSNVGDAQKGAITDAIQKCMSLLSIGSDSYKGLLKNVYLQCPGKPKAERKQAAEKPADQSGSSVGELPEIAGVTFENRQSVIVAIGEKLFDKRQQLKAAGFIWNKSEKVWMKAA